MQRRFFLEAALAATIAPSAAFASGLRLERDGARFAVRAQVQIAAPRETAWATLVDYEALPRFVPGMEASRIVSRSGTMVVVQQTGFVGFGPFTERFDTTLQVDEHRAERIDATAIAGDFDEFVASYELDVVDADATRLTYAARLRPRRAPPPLIGAMLMQSVLQTRFDAMLAEIRQRAG